MTASTSFDEPQLAIVRRAYARQMLAVAGVENDPRLEEAFAIVPRERFLGAPPWQMVVFSGGYRTLPLSDPVLAYQDVNFALAADRGVNNGSPALHAKWLHHARLGPGKRVAHIGAGSGYYTALIAHLVGREGRLLAVEFDSGLAEVAKRNLAEHAQAVVACGDGGGWPHDAVDCVYVNFLVQRPAEAWLEHLRPGGRLVFPLGVPRPGRNRMGGRHTLHGAGLCVERRESGFAVQWLGPAYFVCGEGALGGKEEETAALEAAFERGGVEFVRSLQWGKPTAPERCWFIGEGWSLSYDAVD